MFETKRFFKLWFGKHCSNFWFCLSAVFLALAKRVDEKQAEGEGGGQVLKQTVLQVPAGKEGRFEGLPIII